MSDVRLGEMGVLPNDLQPRGHLRGVGGKSEYELTTLLGSGKSFSNITSRNEKKN